MSAPAPDARSGRDALRHAFDRTFAEAPAAAAGPQEDWLAITMGGDRYALRLSEVAGLHADSTRRALPGSVPELLGLVVLRGILLPAYDLRALLGYPATARSARWCVVAAQAPVALVFEQFDGYVRAPAGAVVDASQEPAVRRSRCVREIVRVDDLVRPVVHVPSLIELIDGIVARAQGHRSSDR